MIPRISLRSYGIRLLVCDTAGTFVRESLVYKTLRLTMVSHGINVSEKDMEDWTGASKSAVIRHFCERQSRDGPFRLDAQIQKIAADFETKLEEAYFSRPNSPGISLIHPNLPKWAEELKQGGIQIGLNTGFPRTLQNQIVEHLKLKPLINGYICSDEVKQGRPYPYMIHHLMEQLGIESVKQVAKVGDTVNDIKEGVNAGCGLVLGVLSGADKERQLHDAGAHMVLRDITEIGL